LLSDNNRRHEQAVLDDMARLGSRVLSIGEMDTDVTFNSCLPESIRNVLYLPVPQLMAYYRSIAKGFNPDKPHNLTAVVKLNLGKI
jgi:glucosamine--fructose-6-phosphate aminotransferase (isomerizing)